MAMTFTTATARADGASQFSSPYLIALAGICALSFLMIIPAILSEDTYWLLYLGQQMVNGVTPYVDFFEVNPPLIIWLNIPPAWLAQVADLPLVGTFKAYMYALIALSLWLSAQLIRISKTPLGPAVFVALAYALMVMPGTHFGQREHIMLVLALPYLFVVAARAEGIAPPLWQVVVATVLAALGFCIKPYFVLIPAAAEIYLLLKIKGATFKRVEPYLMGTIGGAYLASIIVGTPEYLTGVVTYARVVYQAGFGTSAANMVLVSVPIVFSLYIGAMLVASVKKKFSDIPSSYMILILAMLAAFAGLLLQAKGWPNHSYPARALLVLVTIGGLAALLQMKGTRLTTQILAASLLFPIAFNAGLPLWFVKYESHHSEYFGKLADRYPEADSAFIMSAYLYDGFPFILDKNLKWGSRFPSLWLTPGVQQKKAAGDTSALLTEIETFSHRALAEDLARYKPKLVFVDNESEKKHFGKIQYDYVKDFSTNPAFAREWSHYELVKADGSYQLYRRKD